MLSFKPGGHIDASIAWHQGANHVLLPPPPPRPLPAQTRRSLVLFIASLFLSLSLSLRSLARCVRVCVCVCMFWVLRLVSSMLGGQAASDAPPHVFQPLYRFKPFWKSLPAAPMCGRTSRSGSLPGLGLSSHFNIDTPQPDAVNCKDDTPSVATK